MQRVKRIILKIPVLSYVLLLMKEIIQLPRTMHAFRHAIHDMQIRSDKGITRQIHSNERMLDILETIRTLQTNLYKYDKDLLTLKHGISSINLQRNENSESESKSVNSPVLFAEDHRLDDFYLQFENKFRGDEETIFKRLEVYLPYFKQRNKKLSAYPVLDIGSGRGEFLELLHKNDIVIRGLDINSEMVERSKSKGFDTIKGDAYTYLKKQKTGTFSAICGFHIVEHIPFPELMSLFIECHRTVMSDGFVIFETPNPENLTVGSLNFNYDPSHLKPIPPQLLAFCLEYVGFTDIEILPLHPESEVEQAEGLVTEALKRIFGPRDYAIIAKKR